MNGQLAHIEPDRSEARSRFEGTDLRMRSLGCAGATRRSDVPMVGRSDVWQRVLTQALRVASTDTTVLLRGESGTGKEIVAHFVHTESPRRNGPFVAINCGALPETLFESELFGFERGAFTGAQQAKPGQLELASGGVLFLDEVTELPLTAQVKLLRVLQEREFTRLGGTRLIKTNVRVVAATNQDVKTAVEQGRFRDDLYYRINVFDISLPPLRERGPDVVLLARHFLKVLAPTHCSSDPQLAADAEAALLAYHWPGNVRELRNVIERATILCDGDPIRPEHLSLTNSHNAPLLVSTDLQDLERRAIEQALRESAGNKAKAARTLGISRTQLYCRLRKYASHNT